MPGFGPVSLKLIPLAIKPEPPHPWFVPEIELFYRSVEEVVEESLFTTTVVEQGEEQVSLVWKSVDAKLGAAGGLFQRVHQGQRPARASVPPSRTAGARASIVSGETQSATLWVGLYRSRRIRTPM
jgi:hypothetical protein